MKELKIEKALRLRVEEAGGLCIKLNPLWYVGIPDRLILLPGAVIVFVETKAPDGRLKTKQKKWRDRLTLLGFEHQVIWTLEQAECFRRCAN